MFALITSLAVYAMFVACFHQNSFLAAKSFTRGAIDRLVVYSLLLSSLTKLSQLG